MEQKTLIVIGCGSRGKGYSDKAMAMDGKFKIVGIAEPIAEKREFFKKKYGVAAEMAFDTWEPLIALGKIADAAIIATMCTEYCPKELDIPMLLNRYNEYKCSFGGVLIERLLVRIPEGKRPTDCLQCKACEAVCPQKIAISDELAKFSEFAK